jgi:penicillin G amidase
MSSRFLARILLKKAWPQTRGTIAGLPLQGTAEVMRDRWGVPHIYASSLHDVFLAQGFVHAQDRLWQMESLRRLSDGRLTEIAGETALNIDCFARMIGMPAMKKRALAACTDEEHGFLNAYAAGVNAYLDRQRGKLPLEFSSMHFSPERWTPLDELSTVPYLAWFLLSAAYSERLLALARGHGLTLREWNDIFPVAPGAELPTEAYFESLARLKLGALHPCATALHAGLPDGYTPSLLPEILPTGPGPGAGSNNWIFARGSDGAPLLANDPHLAVALPPIWYFCHLCVPGVMNVAGTSLAGIPGIVIGRNEHVAWGLTNVMLDAVDALVLRVDPAKPTRYRMNGEEKEMREQQEVFRLPNGKSVTLPLYQTERGPAITAVEKGVEAVAVLKWVGTLAEGAVADRTFGGLCTAFRATSAAEVLECGRTWCYVSQNLVAADDAGHIGWHATGAVPLRRGYSGRLPADGSAGADWIGFLPYESLPHVMDPPRGWLATANYRPEGPENGRPLSYSWCPPYRYQRIVSALQKMQSPKLEDFCRLQMDLHSVQADRILPALLAYSFSDPKAVEATRMLAGWDREVRAESAAAAVYEVFLIQLEKELIEKRLGADAVLYFNARMYGIVDEILERPDSPLWSEGGDEKTPPRLRIEKALIRAMDFCEARMGRNRAEWKWGSIHRLAFRHPGATSRFTRTLLNPRPFPAHGDSNTLNVSWTVAARDSYDVTTIPSMRMVTSLGDPDSMLIVGPLGQSGQPGHVHYEDLTDRWRKGLMISMPLTRTGVDKISRDVLTLQP